jgi:four helix bundle protein
LRSRRRAELARFISIAAGSAAETEYQLMLARDLGYLPTGTHEQLHGLVTEIKKMLGALRRKLTPKEPTSQEPERKAKS